MVAFSTHRFLSAALVVMLAIMIGACAGNLRSESSVGTASLESVRVDTLIPVPVPGAVFQEARAVAADPLGFLYVADAGKNVVRKLRPTGAVETVLGGPGSREGEFDGPSGVEPTNGLVLFVADPGNHRIQKFSRSYAFLGSIPLTATGETSPSSRVTYRRNDGEGIATGRPVGVASSDAKELFAIDGDRNVVLKWDENHRLTTVIGDVESGRGTLAHPVDLVIGPRSHIYVADRGRRAIVVYDAFGSVIRIIGEGSLRNLHAVAVGEERIYAGLENSIIVYGIDGGLEHAFHLMLDEPLVDITLAERGTAFILTARRLYVLTF